MKAIVFVLLLAFALTGCKSETYKKAYADAKYMGHGERFALAYADSHIREEMHESR